jgi:hypothetical protein
MKHLFLLPLLLFVFASCGSFQNLSEAIKDGRDIANDIHETYNELKPIADGILDDVQEGIKIYESLKGEMGELKDELQALDAEAFAQADKDGSGDLDWLERIAYIIALGGGGAEIARRKLKAAKEARDAAMIQAAAEAAAKATKES